MPNSCTEIYIHFVTATWDRQPLISDAIERDLYQVILAKCRELRCQPIEIGGAADHVHLLVRINSTITIAQLANDTKGASSHLATHALGTPFKWRGSYGAFSVSPDDVPHIRRYIQNQKAHHAAGELVPEGERDEEYRDSATPDS